MRTITLTAARRLAITRQRLAGPRPSATKDSIWEVARDLRCLQLDPISTVTRSHLLVLWSRLGAFDIADVEALLWQDRRLFEYWAHCASIVLTEDYPIHRQRMRHYLAEESTWAERGRTWLEENAGLRDHILTELEAKGPLPSRYFEDRSQAEWASTGWTSGRNVSHMLASLWADGTIMVAGRAGGQKLWDLTERCLPSWTPRTEIEPPEATRRSVEHALRALGVARTKHITQHFTRQRYPGIKAVMSDLERQGSIVQIAVEDEERSLQGPWYVHAEDLPLLDQIVAGDWSPRTTLLSPFDNLICDRARTELLWDFRYRIEIYVPKAKREYGYYVLPILHGDQLIGRIDPQMDRRKQQLQINAVHAEPNAPRNGEVAQAIASAIADLARFLGATTIVYDQPAPEGWDNILRGTHSVDTDKSSARQSV